MSRKDVTIDDKTLAIQMEESFLEYDTSKSQGTKQSLLRRIARKGKALIKARRGKAIIERMMPGEDARRTQGQESWNNNPLISLVVPLYNTPIAFLKDMIESVLDQTYENWELCMADGSDEEHSKVGELCMEYQRMEPKIRYKKLAENMGIAENTNACIQMAAGSYIALFDHDDILHPSALYECMKKLSLEKSQFVYTDEATFSGKSIQNLVTCHRKPDYAPETLRSVNYICHLSVFEKSLLDQTGLFETKYDGSQDHAMILKLTQAAQKVSHVAKILYFWRVHPQSVSMDIAAKDYAIQAGKQAVKDMEAELGREVTVKSSAICATQYRLEYEIPDHPMVTILALCKNLEESQVEQGLDFIRAHTVYENYEILLVPKNDKIRKVLEKAKGEYVVFLEANMEPLNDNWLNQLLMYGQQEQIYAVGAKVLGQGNQLLQTGGRRNRKLGVLEDPYRGQLFSEIGYMGELFYAHNVEGLEYLGMLCKKSCLMENQIGSNNNRRPGERNFTVVLGRNTGRMVFQPYAILRRKR